MNAVKNLADVIRRIQTLAITQNLTLEESQELEFYKTIYKILGNAFKSKVVETLIPFDLNPFTCLEQANTFARPFGLHVVQGVSGNIYLSCAENLE